MSKNISRRAMVAGMGVATATVLAGCAGAEQASAPQTDEPQEPVANDTPEPQQSEPAPAQPQSKAQATLASMTLPQKIAQLFVVTPEQLTGVDVATQAGDVTRNALEEIPVAGLCYFGQNIQNPDQLSSMLANTKQFCAQVGAGVAPFLTIDEEGGPLVARIANSGVFDVPRFPNMADIGATGDTSQAANVGTEIGGYLANIGFTVDFAPDADVLTNPDNQVIGPRAFGSDGQLVADMVAAEVPAMLATGVLPCIKHFPGHGDTEGDSHTGAVYATRTREQMEACEFLPFKAGIQAGCPMVMVGHIETPNVAGDGLPATLSSAMITDILRGELGFDGVVISDSFRMQAITDYYDAGDAALRFIQAGGDIVLMTPDLPGAVAAIQAAVDGGTLTEARIDESVLRVLNAKEAAGLLG